MFYNKFYDGKPMPLRNSFIEITQATVTLLKRDRAGCTSEVGIEILMILVSPLSRLSTVVAMWLLFQSSIPHRHIVVMFALYSKHEETMKQQAAGYEVPD